MGFPEEKNCPYGFNGSLLDLFLSTYSTLLGQVKAVYTAKLQFLIW